MWLEHFLVGAESAQDLECLGLWWLCVEAGRLNFMFLLVFECCCPLAWDNRVGRFLGTALEVRLSPQEAKNLTTSCCSMRYLF